jgi:hypothetical protein
MRSRAGVPLTGQTRDALAEATISRHRDTDTDEDVWTVQLDRQLDPEDWEQVMVVLARVAGGGRYRNGARLHRFPLDPTIELQAVLATGRLPQDPKQRAGWYATPEGPADNLAVNYALNEIQSDHSPLRVLEPSAGEGALADAMEKFHVERDQITCIEADPYRAAVCHAKGYRTFTMRFQAWAARNQGEPPFDVVVMNPPFAEPGDPLAWASHVLLAWSLVGPGGCLTSIVPRSYQHHPSRRAEQVRVLVDRYGRCYDHLDRDDFAESGYGGHPLILHLGRPGRLPQPPQPVHPRTSAEAGQAALF